MQEESELSFRFAKESTDSGELLAVVPDMVDDNLDTDDDVVLDPHVVAKTDSEEVDADVRVDTMEEVVEFWGLPPLIPLHQCVNRLVLRFVLSTVINQNKEAGYGNLNWPRCSAWDTESLALTDGGFCQKQTLYILVYVKIVSL